MQQHTTIHNNTHVKQLNKNKKIISPFYQTILMKGRFTPLPAPDDHPEPQRYLGPTAQIRLIIIPNIYRKTKNSVNGAITW
jgi:hypothetical protein